MTEHTNIMSLKTRPSLHVSLILVKPSLKNSMIPANDIWEFCTAEYLEQEKTVLDSTYHESYNKELLMYPNNGSIPVEDIENLVAMRPFRRSHRRCFLSKGVLRNFAKFAGKHLCQSLFFNKVAGLWATTSVRGTCESY